MSMSRQESEMNVQRPSVDLYWLPLGAGGHSVRLNGRVFEAVESPRRLTADPGMSRRLLDLVPFVPTPVWGRDELGAGEMWNSNSFISWLIASSGLDAESIRVPAGGRAPGWRAGLVVARR